MIPSPVATLPRLYILTGGSRGMGLAMARQILSQGHALVTIARQCNADLSSLISADALRARGAFVEQWQFDLSDPILAAEHLLKWISAQEAGRYARVILINNAGVIPPIAPLADSDWLAVSKALRVDLEAPMLITSAFLKGTSQWTIPRQVLNVSSGLGRYAMASQATYCAAKAGMDNFSASVALDEAKKANGARICSLAPGVIDTDMQVQLRTTPCDVFPDVGRFAELKSSGALVTPEEAGAKVLAWLERADFGAKVIADVRGA